MTYNVFGGMLNLTQLQLYKIWTYCQNNSQNAAWYSTQLQQTAEHINSAAE